MKVYLSGTSCLKNELQNNVIQAKDFYCLESFYSTKDWQLPLISQFKDFLLDSGAYTFSHSNKRCDWDSYADMYAEFVKTNKVKNYFELDIDNIVGLGNVEKLRQRIERQTGTQTIPVWHLNRGKDYFIGMCKDYPYVALGGLVGAGIGKTYEKYFPWFIDTAHKYGAKIHGLGFTATNKLLKYHFDSVDSTAWIAARYGEVFVFKNNVMTRHHSVTKGEKLRHLVSSKDANLFNFKQWVKYQEFADLNL